MIRTLQSSWVTALVGCLIYLAVTIVLLNPSHIQITVPAIQETAVANQSDDLPSWKFRNPEFEQWNAEMRREKESMALREQQLQDLQTRLESDRHELMVVTQTVYQLQSEFDRNVVRIKDQESENLKRQAKVMAAMSPEGAAGLINEMSDEDATRILFTMKPDEASQVLEAMSKTGHAGAKRAATITEQLRRTLPPDPNARQNISSK
jgi:flagellar motility protein MotE (MotC chaperone)